MARDAQGRFLKGHHVSTEWKKGETIGVATQFKPGQPKAAGSGMKKGHKREPFSVDTRSKMSASKKGRPLSAGHLANLREAMARRTGVNHHNWKGGVGTVRSREMVTAKYRLWREAVLAKDNYTCQICYSYGIHLHADHIEPWSLSPELRYVITNGRALCRACHYYVTFKRKMPSDSKWGLTKVTEKRG